MRLFVISDLHLGGHPHVTNVDEPLGSQICHSYQELTNFINWVRTQANGDGSVELVVNGDIVDFLMEDNYGGASSASPWSADEALVLKKLQLIIERTRSNGTYGPFEAMAALLKDGQCLTFLLGNHDVELSLPAVRRYLEQQMQGRGHFRFIYDGEAYVRGDLLIEHGNRYDPWNIVDHSALRQERSLLSRGLGKRMQQRVSGAFVPPPGSFMVINVINEIKHRYRFVDLLKPETEAVLPILLAVHSNLQHVLAAALQMYSQSDNEFLSAAEPMLDGQLSARGSTGEVSLEASLRRVLGDEAPSLFPVETGQGEELGVADAWRSLQELSANIGTFLDDAQGLFADKAVAARDELLRVALAAWRGKLSRDESKEVTPYRDAVQELANEGGFNCVVFGHTHLRKQETIEVNGRSVTYINTGTWTDTMQIPLDLLEPGAAARTGFRNFVNDLKENRLDRYLERCLSYADIQLEQECVVVAELRSFPLPSK
jgi:UDP-2,3-diacylglucosamine pyrophosphatase LpxH